MAPTDSDSRTLAIVQRLSEYTGEGRIKWSEVGPCMYSTSVGGQEVVVLSEDRDDVSPFRFEVKNSDKVIVQRLRTRVLAEVPAGDRRTEAQQSNRAVAALYRLARDRALGISDTLEQIERALELGD